MKKLYFAIAKSVNPASDTQTNSIIFSLNWMVT